jgi:hypothetical protein
MNDRRALFNRHEELHRPRWSLCLSRILEAGRDRPPSHWPSQATDIQVAEERASKTKCAGPELWGQRLGEAGALTIGGHAI